MCMQTFTELDTQHLKSLGPRSIFGHLPYTQHPATQSLWPEALTSGCPTLHMAVQTSEPTASSMS